MNTQRKASVEYTHSSLQVFAVVCVQSLFYIKALFLLNILFYLIKFGRYIVYCILPPTGLIK